MFYFPVGTLVSLWVRPDWQWAECDVMHNSLQYSSTMVQLNETGVVNFLCFFDTIQLEWTLVSVTVLCADSVFFWGCQQCVCIAAVVYCALSATQMCTYALYDDCSFCPCGGVTTFSGFRFIVPWGMFFLEAKTEGKHLMCSEVMLRVRRREWWSAKTTRMENCTFNCFA